MRVELDLTAEEHTAWLKAAGRMSSAEWIKVRCNEQAQAARVRAAVVAMAAGYKRGAPK